jgi:predicted nucleic acid-binding protein
VQELRRVLRRKFGASDAQIAAAEAVLLAESVMPRPARAAAPPVRGPADPRILGSSLAGKAALFVTGDDDLLSVTADVRLPIVDPHGCWRRLRGQRA